MIYTPKNSMGMKLVDANGMAIKYAFEFNDETDEVKFYAVDFIEDQVKFKVENGEVVKCRMIVPGAKMVKR